MNNKISVHFQSRYDDEGSWDDEDNVSPYISVSDPDLDIETQRFPDEIVIPMKTIKLKYTYPLDTVAIFLYSTLNDNGFTRRELAKIVCEGYQTIYDDDDSEGTYGIWGHGIGDLVLYEVSQIGKDVFEVKVDS